MVTSSSQPVNQPKKKKLLPIIILSSLIVVCIILVGYFVYIKSPDRALKTAIDDPELLAKQKADCQARGGISELVGWNGYQCYDKSSLAGADCIQNSDCHGGACRPPLKLVQNLRVNATQWDSSVRFNGDGYVIGTCSEAEYYIDFDEKKISTYHFCGDSILKPFKAGDNGIITAFCD